MGIIYNIRNNMDSNIPTSTTQRESVHLECPEEKLWPLVRELNHELLFGKYCESSVFKSGDAGVVGAVKEIKFKDGHTWTVSIRCIDDNNTAIIYEVIATDPSYACTSLMFKIDLRSVTFSTNNTKSTVLEWTTTYSNDVTLKIIEDNKYKKHDYFAHMLEYVKNL